MSKKLVAVLLSAGFWAGCFASTDFRAPEQRLTDLGADVLPEGTWQSGFGVLGTGYDNLGLSSNLKLGMPANTELGTNLAHDALGIINADFRIKFVDEDWGRIAARVGVKWFNPKYLLLFQATGTNPFEEAGDFNLFIVPITAQATFPVAEWLDIHMNVGYLYQGVHGRFSLDAGKGGGGIGAREVFLQPHLTFYSWNLAFILGAQIPIWAEGLVDVSAETEVTDGVIIGTHASEYQKLDVKDLNTTYLGAEWRWGNAHVRFTMTYGLRFLTGRAKRPLPSLDVYWRF
jgi:hypothetical protein